MRLVLSAVLMVLTMLCVLAIAVSAAGTDLSVTVDDLNVNLTKRGDGVYTKVYDGVTTADVTVRTQPSFGGDDVTLAVESATFDGVNAGETSAIVVSFKLTGADAAKYNVPADVRIPVVIEKKTVTWTANGTATAPYAPGGMLYENLAVTLPGTDKLDGVLAADLAGITLNGSYTVSVNATGAGVVQTQVLVDIGNANYTLEPLTVDVTIAKAMLTDVQWGVNDFSFLYGDNKAYELTAIGYDAAGNAYQMTIVYPINYGNASATPYLVTATPADTANVDLGTALNTKEVRISPAVFTVWMTDTTYVGDGTSKYGVAVEGEIPEALRDMIAYTNKANGSEFTATAAYGKYTVLATLPQNANFYFVDKDGNTVTTLEATLCINKTYVASTGADGDAYNIIVVGENGFSADVIANLSIPESLGKSIRGFRIHKAYSLTLGNVGSADRFTLLISTYEEMLNKNCEPLSANDLYIYEAATGELVPASSKYTVTLKDGYFTVAGYAGDATTTFVIAPQYHTPFLLTAPGIALLVLLVLILIVLMFFAGLYLRRATRGTNEEQTIDTEGETPEVVEAEAEDVAAEDALDALADELAETIEPEADNEAIREEVEAEKAEALAEMLDEASKVSLDDTSTVAEDFADAKADELEETVEAEAEEAEADADALQAAVAAALEEAVNESADAEDAVEIVEEEPVAEEPAVEAFAVVEEDNDNDDDDNDNDDDDDDDGFGGFGGFGGLKLHYIDVMAEPEEYAALLEQEAAGEIRVVYKLKKSFQSRVIQSQGNVQEYYSAIKNALLSFKGNKNRISWNYEAFNKGRMHVAKINAKLKTLYLYLALDPEELADTKYGIVDVSSKKKYATVPVLMKIKGDRKFKYALELIEKLCGEQMQLPKLELEATDYTMPYKTTEELIEEGTIKKLAAGVPIAYFEEQEAPAEETPVETPVEEPAIEVVPATEFAVEAPAEEAPAEETPAEEIAVEAPAEETETTEA